MTTADTEYRIFANCYCAVIYGVAGLGQNFARTKSWPNNGPIPSAPNRSGSNPSYSLSLTLYEKVSDKLACVSNVSDNAGGPS